MIWNGQNKNSNLITITTLEYRAQENTVIITKTYEIVYNSNIMNANISEKSMLGCLLLFHAKTTELILKFHDNTCKL